MKTRKCKTCGERKPIEEMIHCPSGWFCCYEHAIQYAREKQARATRKKRRDRKMEFQNNDIPYQLKLTQAAFNKMRRLEELLWFKNRGLEPTCISCGQPLGNDQWACGHFKTRGAQSGLRFDRKNTFLQHNVRCNKNLSGDIEGTKTTRGFKAGLKERFGDEDGQAIIDYCESNTEPVKWKSTDLMKMRKEFNAEIRRLELLVKQ